MGMKKKSLALMTLAFATTEDTFPITERGNVGNGKEPKELDPYTPLPFNKREGISKMIEDYNLIKSGQSKKGKIKQARIVSKIESYLESGMLTDENLKQ